MFLQRLALFLLITVSLIGCNNEKNRNVIDQRADQVVRMGEVAQAPGVARRYDPLTVSDKIWAGGHAVKMETGKPLPDRLEGARGVALISSQPMGVSEIADALSTQTGIPVRVNQGMSSSSRRSAPSSNDGMSVAYEGPLSGLLALVSGNFGMNWRYDGSSIYLSRYITRVFVVNALPSEVSVTDGIGEAESSGSDSSSEAEAGGSYSMSSSSALKQSSEMKAEVKVWDELSKTIATMLGGEGKSVVSPSSGTITVTTTPDIMQTVAAFVRDENERLSHQIAINVEIYAVTLEDTDDYDVSLSGAMAKIGDFKATLGGAATPVAAATQTAMGSLSLAILNPTDGERGNMLFRALSSIGDTTRVAQFPLTTLNNRPVSRRIGRDRTYVKSLSNETSTESSYSSSTVEPGTVREGFSLQLIPRLLSDGRVLMQYSLSLTDIVDITSFNTGVGVIELPETSSRVFVQQTMLRSGSTLVIGGYDDEKTSQTSQGTGSAYNYILGGGSSNQKSRSMLFIAITPQVLDDMKTEQY